MDDDSRDFLLEKIQQYQNSIIKHSKLGNDEKIISYIKKLFDMPVTVAHLQQTGIGKTINSLRKYNGTVGVASKAVVSKWKAMVAKEESETLDEEEANGTLPDPTLSQKHVSSESKQKSTETSDFPTKSDKTKSEKKSSKEKHHKSRHKSSEEKSRREHKRKHDDYEKTSKKKRSENNEYNNRLEPDVSPDSTNYQNDKTTEKPQPKKFDNFENESKPSSSTKSPGKSEKSKKIKIFTNDGIDSGSGASFADALNMVVPAKNKHGTSSAKKRSSGTGVKSPKVARDLSPNLSAEISRKSLNNSPLAHNPNLLSPTLKLEPLDTNIIAQLPEITTNYKPLTIVNYDSSPSINMKNLSEEEALSVVITSKTQRTKVYSGVKTNWGFVPTLFQLCVRVLQENIDALEYTGGVPYEILKPVLDRASANQLLNTEYHNPYLIADTDELWQLHCRRECRGMQRQEMESWRDMYLRCRDERDAKLRALTVNIKQSIDRSTPVRKAKLAYVDCAVKPPRAISKKQAKYGTNNLKSPLITPSQRLNSIAAGSSEKLISVPNPVSRASTSSSVALKPKKAPLMQKTLALMKGRFNRR